jgi:hypothetical protein
MAVSLALACLLSGALFAQAATPQSHAADNALDYIRTLQNADGGFPAFGSDSSAGATIDAILAFAADGVDVDDIQNGGNSPVDYLKTQAAAYSGTAGGAAKLVIGLVAAGEDPRDFDGVDYLAKMRSYYDSSTHRYGQQTVDHAIYMLARESLGLSTQAGTAAYLESMQLPEGCWEYADFGCDTNSTAMAVQALVVAGVDSDDAPIQTALDYLASAQNADGGFPYLVPSDSDANSTAFVLQALVAAGEDIDAGGPWEKPGGNTPMQALLSYQDAATGAFTRGGHDNAYATYQAVPALLLQPLLLPPSEEATKTPRPTHTPAATATATPAATATPEPTATMIAAIPGATAVSQVLPAITGPAAPPRALAAAGEGAYGGHAASKLVLSLLLVASGCLTSGLMAHRRRGSRE